MLTDKEAKKLVLELIRKKKTTIGRVQAKTDPYYSGLYMWLNSDRSIRLDKLHAVLNALNTL